MTSPKNVQKQAKIPLLQRPDTHTFVEFEFFFYWFKTSQRSDFFSLTQRAIAVKLQINARSNFRTFTTFILK